MDPSQPRFLTRGERIRQSDGEWRGGERAMRVRCRPGRGNYISRAPAVREEEEEDGAAAWARGAAADRGPEAAEDLLPEAASGADQEGGGARRALRGRRRPHRRQPLRPLLPLLRRARHVCALPIPTLFAPAIWSLDRLESP